MKWKTAALMILLVLAATAFAETLAPPVNAKNISTVETDMTSFGGGLVEPLGDPVPGGPDPGGDD